MSRQDQSDSLSLICVDDHECYFGLARFDDDIAATADNRGPAVLIDFGDERDVIDEVDLHEEFFFRIRKSALGHEEAEPPRVNASAIDGQQHVGLVLRTQRTDFDRSSVTELLTSGIGGCRHCGSPSRQWRLSGRACEMRRRRFQPLIWIKPEGYCVRVQVHGLPAVLGEPNVITGLRCLWTLAIRL